MLFVTLALLESPTTDWKTVSILLLMVAWQLNHKKQTARKAQLVSVSHNEDTVNIASVASSTERYSNQFTDVRRGLCVPKHLQAKAKILLVLLCCPLTSSILGQGDYCASGPWMSLGLYTAIREQCGWVKYCQAWLWDPSSVQRPVRL